MEVEVYVKFERKFQIWQESHWLWFGEFACHLYVSLSSRACRLGEKKNLDHLHLSVCVGPIHAWKFRQLDICFIVVMLLWHYAAVIQEIKEQLVSVGPLEAGNISALGHHAPW